MSEIQLYNLNIEKAILSSIIFEPSIFEEIISLLKSDDFYLPFHKSVFEAMMELESEDLPIDEEFLRQKLIKNEKFDESGYLDILETNPLSNTVAYCNQIKEYSIKRELIKLTTQIKSTTLEQDLPSDDVLDVIQKKLYEISLEANTKEFKDSNEIVKDTLEHILKMKEIGNNGVVGVDTGFKELNELTSGFGNGDLIIVAARPAMGKTSFVLNLAQKALDDKRGVAIFSLEMPAEQLILRMLSAKTSIPLQKLKVGDMDDNEWSRLTKASDEMAKAKLFVDDDGLLNIHQLRSKLRKLKMQHPEVSLCIIDYLQLMSSTGSKDRHLEVSEISRGLKLLARELNIPILALSQLNRGVESRHDKRPMLSDIRESGCLAADSIIIDAQSGKRYKIEELVESKDVLPIKTKAMDSDLKIKEFNIVNAFCSGVKTLYKLTTKSGKSIKATANHKFYRVDGWFRLDKLKVGDKIATPKSINLNLQNSLLSKNELILLAHLLGDGCILKDQPYHYTSQDLENIEIVKKTAKELFGIDAKVVKQKNWWHLYLKSPYPLTHNKKHPITLWYEKLNIKRVRSYEKEIPQAVFQSNNKSIKLFLHHLWATDGSITVKKLKSRKDNIAIYYATSSQVLAKQVQSLLLRVGIISKISLIKQIKKERVYRPSYHVAIQGKENLEKFLNEIGSFGKRGEEKTKYLDILSKIVTNPNNASIDKTVWQTYIKDAKDKANISWREFCKLLGMSYCGTSLFKSGISQARMSKIATFLDDKNISNLANSDIYWDEIVSIEKLEDEKTYDLTVDEVHNFIANDIIVHNSIEQDADMILFVYRDDVYKMREEKEKEKKAKAEGKEYKSDFFEKPEEEAEIIIGKNRNGPIGVANLIFQKRFTRFVDKSSIPLEIVYESAEDDAKYSNIEIPDI